MLVYSSEDFPSDKNISTPDFGRTLPEHGLNHLGLFKIYSAGAFPGQYELLNLAGLLGQQSAGGGGGHVQARGEAQQCTCCTLSASRVNLSELRVP